MWLAVLTSLLLNPTFSPGHDYTIPLFVKDTTSYKELKNTLVVFVGQKLDVENMSGNSFDECRKVTYRVLQMVYGEFPGDVVEFLSYDHYGHFGFLDYEHCLMFLEKERDTLFHSKYMYEPVFYTHTGRWAGPYSREYKHANNANTTIKPQKIRFVKQPRLVKHNPSEHDLFLWPKPYFRFDKTYAYPLMGNYVEELFLLNKHGLLTARGLF